MKESVMNRVMMCVTGLLVMMAAAACEPQMNAPGRNNPRPALADRPDTRIKALEADNRRLSQELDQLKAQPATTKITAGGVSHVVLVWLKKPGDAEARTAVLGAIPQIKTIPGVIDVQAGRVIPSTRPVVDSTFD